MRVWALILLVVLVGCTNKLSGELSVDGEKLELTSCRNGSIYGYRGVEVSGTSGLRVRVGATQTGEAQVAVMPKGAKIGVELGPCGSLTIKDQNSTVNDVKNVEGEAELDCTREGITIKGAIRFENCH